ncbi:MAG: peptidylprolyl isomerase [Acidimicrobiia bacterium]
MRSHTTRLALLALSVALLAAACGGGDKYAGAASSDTSTGTADSTTTTGSLPEITLPSVPPSDYAGFTAQPTACGATAPEPAREMTFDAPEDQGLDPAQMVKATITTSCGDIVVELDPSIAPETVNSFVFLARSGYFDGTVSHRIVPGFVVQAGDPTATGRGGPGYVIPDELPEAGFVYATGSLAMANSGPNTGGSQFFITLADAPLPNDYSYFGKVVGGFDALDAIAGIPLGVNPFGEKSVPLETLYIERVIING